MGNQDKSGTVAVAVAVAVGQDGTRMFEQHRLCGGAHLKSGEEMERRYLIGWIQGDTLSLAVDEHCMRHYIGTLMRAGPGPICWDTSSPEGGWVEDGRFDVLVWSVTYEVLRRRDYLRTFTEILTEIEGITHGTCGLQQQGDG